MTLTDAYLELDLCIQGVEDDHYALASGYADWLSRMASGRGHEEWVRDVRPRESQEEKDDRARIYIPATKSAIGPVRSLVGRVYRSDGRTFTLTHPVDERLQRVRAALADYYDGQGVEDYLDREQFRLAFTDPNAYLLTLRTSERDHLGNTTAIRVYPLLIPSAEVPRSGRRNGVLEWIIRRQYNADNRQTLTLYAAGMVVTMAELADDETGDLVRTVEGVRFAVQQVTNTGSAEFPGDQIGAYLSEITPNLRVSVLDPASELLRELVKAKSILDVALDKHCFPHRYEYNEPCDYMDAELGLSCADRGYINAGTVLEDHDRIPCPRCGGRKGGRKSENNVTRVKVPTGISSARDAFKLSDLYHYEQVDLTTIVRLQENVDRLIDAIPYAVFGGQHMAPPTVSRTATETVIEHQSATDRLYPMPSRYARLVEKIARVTAQYLGAGDGFTVAYAFPENLRLQNLTELVNRLGALRRAGASQEAIFAVQCEIVEKTHAGSGSVVANMKAFERLRPWRSLATAEVLSIIAQRADGDTDAAIWLNFDRIKSELLDTYPDFHRFTLPAARRLVVEKATAIAAEAEYAEGPQVGELEIGEVPIIEKPADVLE